ncbi:Putative serine/threonine-protein kinase mps1 [Glycine soja]|uniref:Putative serine/threonine-protein kinase mps1 n=1 Tax=Glycine soja TaxID=3848 RepID=A0A0B2RRM2_GLYSO|nr:Putative serine/threonine-protein kinase mps1 [Glycine soja]
MDDNPNPSLPRVSSSSSQEFLKQVQAALKRHGPLGATQSHNVRPKRATVALRNAANKFEEETPSISDTGEGCKNESSLQVESLSVGAHKKVQFLTEINNATAQPQGLSVVKATELENISSHMGSLALTDEASIGFNHHVKHQNTQQAESETSLVYEGGKSSPLPKRTIVTQDHLQQFKNFLRQPATQSSVVGLPCPTTTSVHSTSAPMLNSITHCSNSCIDSGSHVAAEPYGNLNVNPHPITQGDVKSPNNSLKDTNRISIDQVASAVQDCNSLIDAELTLKQSDPSKEQQGCMLKDTSISKCTSCRDDMLSKGEVSAAVTNIQPQVPTSSSEVKLESSKLEKQEKNTSSKASSGLRKRAYDPELFFKVNGKLYQRLGKIGSGGSSEVHKVISSDCTIYALKRIKLKGRDYATAYGFCQEIKYLNRLKGKNNIIQLIDYEVTDKALFEGVINGSFSNKDGRVKDDGYIYMVLEYGEIDLAHMLSQKWKELDGSNQTIDENWLRFYWQQILQAVNTIHEERIVHSDLKPANFLLVKGSLKLIDFGIAKAIMSDTTNIQRDSQVGTLSYMSPEAFMCNESDASGNIIKCGRPSDIWSLGCILYQMVYGRTPFADYKTFWAKFKVITDPNHEIMYAPVSNPWLLDLMRRCLAWDRNERWRIPQLLQHPFLVPPVPCHSSFYQEQTFKLLQLISEACINDPESSQLCCQLQQVLGNPIKSTSIHSLNSLDQQHKLLSRISELCILLQERLTKTDKL